jgi:hypothetical protein
MSDSFWDLPEISDVKVPLTILKEQAALLTKQTNGRLQGGVTTTP